MKPHEERMVTEIRELSERINKLEDFIYTNQAYLTLVHADKFLLREQLKAMLDYKYFLGKRISRIGK